MPSPNSAKFGGLHGAALMSRALCTVLGEDPWESISGQVPFKIAGT